LDTATYLLGKPVHAVQASIGDFDRGAARLFDISITVATSSRRLGTLVLSYSAGELIDEIIVIAERGVFRVVNGVMRLGSAPAPSPSGLGQESSRLDSPLRQAVCAQDAAFVASLLGRAEPNPTPAQLLPMFAVLDEVDSTARQAMSTVSGRLESE
jgi:hypothetical protein